MVLFFSRLLNSKEFVSMNTENIRLFVSGSAPLSPAVWEEFYRRTQHRILERYGMTESRLHFKSSLHLAIIISSNPYEAELRKPGSVGLPVRGVEVCFLNSLLILVGPSNQ